MYISKSLALELFQNGFKRPAYQDMYNNYDFFEYDNEEWVLGGKILPSGDILSPEDIYKKGTWLPSAYDLMLWLEENNFTFNLVFNGEVHSCIAKDNRGTEYKGKGANIENALFNAIMKVLKHHGGNLIERKYDIENGQYLGKE
ncbi:hypothetical protein [Clostridium sp. C8-1-8]|uniref:hypothetical protein n=1 Tax=Clostridium sp. C8-1-8 TaxID=2698831 RepID=UPI00136C1A42|nr:hypothetical protein [Clostridium sp. C8-1-8]